MWDGMRRLRTEPAQDLRAQRPTTEQWPAPRSRTVLSTLVEQSLKSRAEFARSIGKLKSALASADVGIAHLRTALSRIRRDYSAMID
jgi:hypothetical protein